MIQVRPLLSVYFNADKMFIHELGNLHIFEALMFHDMAPMTGSISNTDQNRFIFRLGDFQCLITPWKPVYGIICMLQEIWAGLFDQPVWRFYHFFFDFSLRNLSRAATIEGTCGSGALICRFKPASRIAFDVLLPNAPKIVPF